MMVVESECWTRVFCAVGVATPRTERSEFFKFPHVTPKFILTADGQVFTVMVGET
jgi:hypothetical protein